MRKNIDIPEEIVKDLKKMAIDADKDLKNFIQDHLVSLVRGQKKEQKTSTNVKSKRCLSIGHNVSVLYDVAGFQHESPIRSTKVELSKNV